MVESVFDHGVGAAVVNPAIDCVRRAVSREESVVAEVTEELVVPGTTLDQVVPEGARQEVAPRAAVEPVVAVAPGHVIVVSGRPDEDVIAATQVALALSGGTAEEPVVALSHDHSRRGPRSRGLGAVGA